MAKNRKIKDARDFTSMLVHDAVLDAEKAHDAAAITFVSSFDNPKKKLSPGGQCSCCGASPRVDGLFDYCLIMKAGISDSDGVYYSMLCAFPDGDGCLPEIRRANAKRKPTMRDEAAAIVSELMGDDVDGAEAFMDDLDYLGEFD